MSSSRNASCILLQKKTSLSLKCQQRYVAPPGPGALDGCAVETVKEQPSNPISHVEPQGDVGYYCYILLNDCVSYQYTLTIRDGEAIK
ncbi:hypothetical protein AVEN_15932-1 [Araneus ventricosus]|uniref:Uncharacterized protein n=1 Tax=Araneus ventricosus TaxID=182803 RepID=A0A4Y2SPK5_ARAVE|nr:hypothetical protein AVEN_15932-1 [Araneus ventricosus]